MTRKQPELKPIYDKVFFEGAKKIDSLAGKKLTFEEFLKEFCELGKDYIMSPEEKEEQRRSFAYGNLKIHNPNITRKMIDKIADEMKNEQPSI